MGKIQFDGDNMKGLAVLPPSLGEVGPPISPTSFAAGLSSGKIAHRSDSVARRGGVFPHSPAKLSPVAPTASPVGHSPATSTEPPFGVAGHPLSLLDRKLVNLERGRRARWLGKIPIPPHAHPLVRRLFEIMNKQKVTLSEVGFKSGLARKTISDWRYFSGPSVQNLEAALNAVGYELRIMPKREP